jgi:hypothetical protein
LLLATVAIIRKPGKAVPIPLFLALGMRIPIHAQSLTGFQRTPFRGRLVNTLSPTIVNAVDAPGSPPPQTGSLCLTGLFGSPCFCRLKVVRMARVFEPHPSEGFTPKGIWPYTANRKRVAGKNPPLSTNYDLDDELPPGSAGHEGRSSPKRSAKKCQLESHGAVLSPVDSSWAQD